MSYGETLMNPPIGYKEAVQNDSQIKESAKLHNISIHYRIKYVNINTNVIYKEHVSWQF